MAHFNHLGTDRLDNRLKVESCGFGRFREVEARSCESTDCLVFFSAAEFVSQKSCVNLLVATIAKFPRLPWIGLQEMDKAHIAELQNINLSLHTLGRCIEALASGSTHVSFHSAFCVSVQGW